MKIAVATPGGCRAPRARRAAPRARSWISPPLSSTAPWRSCAGRRQLLSMVGVQRRAVPQRVDRHGLHVEAAGAHTSGAGGLPGPGWWPTMIGSSGRYRAPRHRNRARRTPDQRSGGAACRRDPPPGSVPMLEIGGALFQRSIEGVEAASRGAPARASSGSDIGHLLRGACPRPRRASARKSARAATERRGQRPAHGLARCLCVRVQCDRLRLDQRRSRAMLLGSRSGRSRRCRHLRSACGTLLVVALCRCDAAGARRCCGLMSPATGWRCACDEQTLATGRRRRALRSRRCARRWSSSSSGGVPVYRHRHAVAGAVSWLHRGLSRCYDDHVGLLGARRPAGCPSSTMMAPAGGPRPRSRGARPARRSDSGLFSTYDVPLIGDEGEGTHRVSQRWAATAGRGSDVCLRPG